MSLDRLCRETTPWKSSSGGERERGLLYWLFPFSGFPPSYRERTCLPFWVVLASLVGSQLGSMVLYSHEPRNVWRSQGLHMVGLGWQMCCRGSWHGTGSLGFGSQVTNEPQQSQRWSNTAITDYLKLQTYISHRACRSCQKWRWADGDHCPLKGPTMP